MALATFLRVLQLDFQPLWWDEGYSVFFATRDFGALLARTAVDIHPPLYYALLQMWIATLGKDAAVLRLLSVVIGVATIPLLYLVAKKLFNARVGVVAAFLLAIAPLHIYYSQELRMYGLVTLLALASVALQLELLTNVRRSTLNAQTILYIIFTAALLYTQYLAGFIIAAQIAIVLYLKYRARWEINLRAWLVRWLVVGALYLPWVIYAGPKLYAYVTDKVGIEQYSHLDPLTYLAQHLTAFSTGHVTNWNWLAWGAVIFVALAIFGFIAKSKIENQKSKIAIGYPLSAIYLFTPLLCGFLVNLVYTFHPLGYERLLLFAAPFFLIFVACGIVALFERKHALGYAATTIIALLCALSLYDFFTVERYPDEDYRPLIAEMEKYAAENDLVYALYPWQIGYLESYYRGAQLNVFEVRGDAWMKNAEMMNRELREMRETHPRAWILAYQKQGRILEDRLLNEYSNDYFITDQNFGNTRLVYVAQGNDTDFELAPIVYAPDLTLRLNYAAFVPTNAAPSLALARFGWNAASDAYSYSLRVTDASGKKIAQQDAPISNGATIMRRALTLSNALAPGEYTLRLVAYQRANGAPLKTPQGSDDMILAKITITP